MQNALKFHSKHLKNTQLFLPNKYWTEKAAICMWILKIVASVEFPIAAGLRKYTGWILHVFVSPSNLFYSQLQNNYIKEFLQPRILFTTDDFHLFACCWIFSREFLLNISTWSILVYPANPCSRISMGEGLNIMIINCLSPFEGNTEGKVMWKY